MGLKMKITVVVIKVALTGLLLSQDGRGQAHDFKSLRVNNGLPSMFIHDLHQDEQGYMWIASGGGISRFDGTNFQTYTAKDGLRDNWAHQIFEDARQDLWFATSSGGVAKLRGDSIAYQFTDTPLDESYVTRIEEGGDGSVWIAAYGAGIFKYDGEEISAIDDEDGSAGTEIWDVFVRDEDEIWIASTSGVSVYDGEAFVTQYGEQWENPAAYRIEEDHLGRMWVVSEQGVRRFDDGEWTTISEIGRRNLTTVFDMKSAADSSMWIGTMNNGVYVLEEADTQNYTRITNRNGLNSNYIFRLYEDSNQNMWVATAEQGINIYRGEQFRFFNTSSGLRSEEILSLKFADEEQLWIGTGAGLSSYNLSNQTFESIDVPVEDVLDERVWEIQKFSNGDLLLLLEDSNLWHYDGEEFYQYCDYHGLELEFVYDMHLDDEDELWLGTTNGLVHFDGETRQRYTVEDGLPSGFVSYIYQANDGNIWVSTFGGVSRFNGEDFYNLTGEDGLEYDEAMFITQGPENDFWIGSVGGLSHYNPDSGEVNVIDSGQGLDIVGALYLWFDRNNHLWIGTYSGIYQIDINRYHEQGDVAPVVHRLSEMGSGIEGNYGAVAEDSEGRGYLGSMEGIIRIDPSIKQREIAAIPNVHIEGLEINAQQVDWEQYTDELHYTYGNLQLPEVMFPNGEHSYTFSFAAIDFLNPEDVDYRYKLKGFEDDWRHSKNTQTATYTNLSAGNYGFKIQARNQNGQWSESATYEFAVALPFWLTSWFWVIITILAGGLFYAVIHFRTNKFEKAKLQQMVDEQTRELSEAVEEKETLLKETHHRVKNNLAVIYSLLEMQKQYVENPQALSVLKESQLRIHTISDVHENLYQQQKLSAVNAPNYIRDLVEKISKSYKTWEKDIEVEIDVDDIDLRMKYSIPCGLILNELIGNAFKYAFDGRREGRIRVAMKEYDDEITMVVADNGVGLPENGTMNNTKSLGMSIIKSLTRQLDANLDMNSDSNGTEFKIHLFKKTLVKA